MDINYLSNNDVQLSDIINYLSNPIPNPHWQLYTSPTALRLLMKSSDEYVTKYDKSSLRPWGDPAGGEWNDSFVWRVSFMKGVLSACIPW